MYQCMNSFFRKGDVVLGIKYFKKENGLICGIRCSVYISLLLYCTSCNNSEVLKYILYVIEILSTLKALYFAE